MKSAKLVRIRQSLWHTLGVLTTDLGYQFYTLEPPWKNNEPNVSCIPVGTYQCVFGPSSRFGRCYWLEDVPDRSDIEIHAGNKATETHGCIMLGMAVLQYIGEFEQLCQSDLAVNQLALHMNKEEFTLAISEAFEGSQPTYPTAPATR